MPGKYPTINSISTTRIPLEPGIGLGLSNSDTPTLRLMFANSPIYALTAEAYRATAAEYLQPAIQKDTDNFPHFPLPGVTMDYQGAPEFPGGDPALYEGRYLPYLVVPTDPSAGIDGTSSGAAREANDNFGSGLVVTSVRPDVTSEAISKVTIVPGPIGTLGQSLAHALNPGSQS